MDTHDDDGVVVVHNKNEVGRRRVLKVDADAIPVMETLGRRRHGVLLVGDTTNKLRSIVIVVYSLRLNDEGGRNWIQTSSPHKISKWMVFDVCQG
jgi:hypothetical protein